MFDIRCVLFNHPLWQPQAQVDPACLRAGKISGPDWSKKQLNSQARLRFYYDKQIDQSLFQIKVVEKSNLARLPDFRYQNKGTTWQTWSKGSFRPRSEIHTEAKVIQKYEWGYSLRDWWILWLGRYGRNKEKQRRGPSPLRSDLRQAQMVSLLKFLVDVRTTCRWAIHKWVERHIRENRSKYAK